MVALTRSGERVHAYLGGESDHFFTSAFMFVGLLVVLGVVAAVAVWQWTPHRGPVMVAALAVGCAVATAVAAGVAAALAHWRFGSLDIAGAPSPRTTVSTIVVEAASVFFGHSLAADRRHDPVPGGHGRDGLRVDRGLYGAR